MVSSSLCVRCKGKLLCGAPKCAVLEHYSSLRKATAPIHCREFSGSSPPSIFVSWKNYPNVSIAPLAPAVVDEKNFILDAPEQWYGFHSSRIVSMREQLIQSHVRMNAFEAANPSYELLDLQEIVMAEKPVELEIELQHKPLPRLSFHESVAPMGPSAALEDLRLVSNPIIPKKIDYLVSDVSAKSSTALLELYGGGVPVSTLYKLLSAGTLGVKNRRKLVPTRWSITAVDSNISKSMVEEKVKGFQQISDFRLFHSNYLDNDFWVLLIPSAWSFEQLETWLPGGIWTQNETGFSVVHDHEFYSGRKDYASNVEGAYYSSRLAVAEYLLREKRQAAAIVFREIGEGYDIPLGVWQIRENVRHALAEKPLVFFSPDLALKYLSQKLVVPMSQYKKESALLDAFAHQKRIADFS